MEKISSMVEKIGKRNIQIGAAVIIVAVVAVALFVGKSAVAPESEVSDVEKTATTTEATTTPVVKKTTTPPANQQVSLSYQKALTLYPADKRIQLTGTTACQATPANVTYKNGTSIMIDNRSAQAHTVKVDGTYVIPGYGFKVVKLSSATFPRTILMDCDKQQNIATFIIQK